MQASQFLAYNIGIQHPLIKWEREPRCKLFTTENLLKLLATVLFAAVKTDQ
jgi:hypothetical protein